MHMKIKVTDQNIFSLAYMLLIIKRYVYCSYYINNEFLLQLTTLMNYTSLFLMVVVFLRRQKKGVKELIVDLGIVVFFAIEYYLTKSTEMVIWLLFVITSHSIDVTKTIKKVLNVSMMLTFVIVLSYTLGIVDEYAMIKEGRLVHSWGFVHPNSLATSILQIALMYLFVNDKRISWIKLIILTIINLFFERVTGCRIAFFTYLFFLLLIAYKKINIKAFESKICRFVLSSLPSLAAIFSFVGGYGYVRGNPTMIMVNDFFSDRFNWIGRYLLKYRIGLLGQVVDSTSRLQNSGGWSSVDNAYIVMGLNYGLIFLLLYCFAMGILMWHFVETRNKVGVAICVAFVFMGLTENQAYSIAFNFMLLYLGDIIYEKKNDIGTAWRKKGGE